MKKIIKILISLAMLGLVFGLVDLSRLKEVFLSIPLSTALIVITGYAAGQLLSSYKWWLIARAGKVDAPWSSALKAYFIGSYANAFGLGLVGGDVLRALLLAGKAPSKAQAMASVVADRAHGLAVLAIVGIVFAFCDGRNTISSNFLLIALTLAAAIIFCWFFLPGLILRLLPDGSRLAGKLSEITHAFPRNPAQLCLITSISIVFHLSQIWLHWVMVKGLELNIPFVYLLSSVPFVNILGSLPVSWNGVGVRENAYVLFLKPELTYESALAFGAIWLLALTATSALGGVIALLSGNPHRNLPSSQSAEN